MYEFNGWFVLANSSDVGQQGEIPADKMERLRGLLAAQDWTPRIELLTFGGQSQLRLTGATLANRGEADDIEKVLKFVAHEMPGSYGILYETSNGDDLPRPPGPLAFRVHVMTAGELTLRMDPFLSPANPVIED